ncbi:MULTISPECIES: alpha/beta fold hydrolase [Acidiphilium]|uniref:Alpha/beta fold hydrolase n=1 Tax=Acidiphilium iwatense TaxID=768198 RepID=A0ABS9DYR9_9PROT|nr:MULTISPECIES: alpha/beta fold hydrolase [Acidiphilium]MCF3947896.1 alpha/beta fold hydrolase [Acidiphilium iwatense]
MSGEAAPADDDFTQAVLHEVLAQDRALIEGVAAYRRHSYRRTLADPPILWSEGESRLLDYNVTGGGDGSTILFVPSLVNRAYVLDLMEDASFLRFLAGNGVRPLLLDWGWPGPVERQFTLTDYIAGRLERVLGTIGQPVVLAGYCMGGLLALAAALRSPARIQALALLATPWDFHADNPEGAENLGRSLPLLEPFMRATGTLPIDALQMLFAILDPFGVAEKYRGFAALDPNGPRARRFVALEDWLNDGVPLAAPVARETLGGWYGENAPARGQWRVAGLPVDPTQFDKPALIATPARDRLVPPASAAALAASIPHATVIAPNAGHIGMVAGMSAELALWQPFLDWVLGL